MPGDGAVRGLRRTFGEYDIRGDMPLRPVPHSSSWSPECAACSQASDELTLERTPTLDEQRLIDRLVADAHGLIIREVDLQTARDLLRTPRGHPPPILPMRLVQPLPCRWFRPDDDPAVRTADTAGETLLDVLTQPVVGREPRRLRSLRRLLSLPLRHQRPVLQRPTARGRVAAQLARDRSRVTADPACDLTHPDLLRAQQRDLLALLEGQVAAGRLGQ